MGGCGFNVGVEYAKHFQLSFGADWSLMNVSKANDYTYKNRSFTFSLGYIL
ncbi:outer membrane beta-barrel protein [Bacteroides sp. BFG-257]|uniref:outer membrane beta-barrel protein n=1 Tax=Bacteroides sp. BFG-257 TaxID=2972761 RepID=UPI0038D23742